MRFYLPCKRFTNTHFIIDELCILIANTTHEEIQLTSSYVHYILLIILVFRFNSVVDRLDRSVLTLAIMEHCKHYQSSGNFYSISIFGVDNDVALDVICCLETVMIA